MTSVLKKTSSFYRSDYWTKTIATGVNFLDGRLKRFLLITFLFDIQDALIKIHLRTYKKISSLQSLNSLKRRDHMVVGFTTTYAISAYHH